MKTQLSPEYLQSLGATLKYHRYLLGFSLREMAKQLKVSHTLVAKLEKGQIRPSLELMAHGEAFLGHPLRFDATVLIHLYQIFHEIFDAVLFHDFSTLEKLKEKLLKAEEKATESGLLFLWKLSIFIIESHDYNAVLTTDEKFVLVLQKMVDEIDPSLQFLSDLTLALYDRYHFRLSRAKKRLEKIASQYLNPHHKALVKDRLGDVYYHTFDRSKAIKLASEAIQTYQTFHNVSRAILSDIKINLYGKRQHQSEEVLPYERYIEQAKTYQLTEVIHDISYVWALRIFRFKKYQAARKILESLDLSHPQFYHYYVIVLYGSQDFSALKEFLEKQPLKAPMIKIFEPAIDYVKAVFNMAPDAVLEHHLKEYLRGVNAEELYGESRWAETLLDAFYLQRRRYKEASQLKEHLIELILT